MLYIVHNWTTAIVSFRAQDFFPREFQHHNLQNFKIRTTTYFSPVQTYCILNTKHPKLIISKYFDFVRKLFQNNNNDEMIVMSTYI